MHCCIFLFVYLSWRTAASESCLESVARPSWSWREKTHQSALHYRRCWPALTSAYERVREPTVTAQPLHPSPPAAATTVYSLFPHIPLHLSPYRPSPFSWSIYSMMLQSCIPVWRFRHKAVWYILFLLVLLLCLLILPACMSPRCLQSFNVWMGKRRAWVKINL